MSVTELDKVDAMAKSMDEKELIFLISDHLDWSDEYTHLVTLQDKINAYLEFIESKQYAETYPKNTFDSYVIEIHFLYGMSENCFKFLDTVANQLEDMDIKIRIEDCREKLSKNDPPSESVADNAPPAPPPISHPIYVSRTYPNQEGPVIVYSFGYSPDNLFAKFGVNSEDHKPYGIATPESAGKEAYQIVTERLHAFVMSQPDQQYPQKFVIELDGVSGVE